MPVQYQIDGTIDAIAMLLLYHLYHICVIKNRQYLENYRLFCLFLVTFLLTGQIVDIRSKLLCYLHKSIRFSQVISETLPGSYHGFMITAFVFRPAKTPAPRNRCSKWNFTLDGLFLFFCLRFIKTGRIDAFHYPWYINCRKKVLPIDGQPSDFLVRMTANLWLRGGHFCLSESEFSPPLSLPIAYPRLIAPSTRLITEMSPSSVNIAKSSFRPDSLAGFYLIGGSQILRNTLAGFQES